MKQDHPTSGWRSLIHPLQALDDLASNHLSSLLYSSSSTALALEFLTDHLSSTSPESRDAIWASLFVSPPSSAILIKLINAVGEGALPAEMPSAGLDSMMLEFAARVLGNDTGAYSVVELEILMRLMVEPRAFLCSPRLYLGVDIFWTGRTLHCAGHSRSGPLPHRHPSSRPRDTCTVSVPATTVSSRCTNTHSRTLYSTSVKCSSRSFIGSRPVGL